MSTSLERALESDIRRHGINHPSTLRRRVDLALDRFARGEFAAAAALHTSVLTERERALGPDARDTVESRRYLAGTLARMGRAAEAEALLRRDVASGSPEARTVLADLLFQQDRLPEALAEFTAAGGLLAARQGRAGVLFALGRFAEAEAEYRSLEIPTDDPNHGLVRASLEHLRAATGDADGALVELRALLAESQSRWGADAPVTCCTLTVLGDVLLMADQPAAAVEAFASVVSSLTSTLGTADSMTLCTRHMIGAALLRVGRIDEAERELLAAAERDDRPPSHSCSLATRQGLARVASARGEFGVAAEVQVAVVEGLTNLYGPDHPNTLEARFDAAELLRWRAFPAEALAAHQEILAARTRVLGPDHPDTRRSASAIRPT